MNIQEIVKYLNEDIRRSIVNDVLPLVNSSTVPRDGGLFAAPRLIFAYVDFLGYLYTGESSSKSAVAFIRKYFGCVDPRYSEVGGLIYHIYRHGTIHEYEPKSVKLTDGTIVAWSVYKDSSGELHLSGHAQGKVFSLRIHLNSLYNDLNSAIDLYVQDLKRSPDLMEKFKKAKIEIKTPESEDTVRVKGKAYITDSDFDFIKALNV